ncbi:MAG: OmpA family protein [Candidatus Cloacimonadota bacterium]
MMNSLKYYILPCLALILLVSASCSRNRNRFANFEERGMFEQRIKIQTLPTKARIFINEVEIGESPLTYRVRHEDSRMLNIKAVPVYPNQYTQNIFLMVPPIPKTMTIYMNHYPEDYDLPQDRAFTPPAKPEAQVIVQTETQIDTVYIHQTETRTEILALPIIYFDTAHYDIRAGERDKLNQIVQIMESNPDLDLEIYGFADRRSSDSYNLQLSLNRANSVREHLISLGVEPERLRAFGHGRVNRISPEGPDDDLQQNRKVSFVLKSRAQ